MSNDLEPGPPKLPTPTERFKALGTLVAGTFVLGFLVFGLCMMGSLLPR